MDHRQIFLSLYANLEKSRDVPRYNFAKGNWQTFTMTLELQLNLKPILLNTTHIDKAITALTCSVKTAIHSAVPQTTFNTYDLPSRPEMQDLINTHNKLCQTYRKTRSCILKNTINHLQNTITVKTKERRRNNWNTIVGSLEIRDNYI